MENYRRMARFGSEQQWWRDSVRVFADGDTAVMRAASGYSGQIRVRLVSGMHPEALFMLHGFGHSLPVESRARGLGLGDQHFMSGGLTQEDELAHGLALQAHFVRLTPCDTSAKDN